MRFKLTLQVKAETLGKELPINYQYELSSTIYRILSQSNSKYSSWLHENGFASEKKKFKLFSFSHLIVPRYGINKERQRLIIQSDTVDWYITFLPEKSTQNFIQGVFMQQDFQVGDKLSAVEFSVCEVQALPSLEYKEEMCFKTLSPICISLKKENGNTDYLSPSDTLHTKGLLTGLLARYQAFYGNEYEGERYCEVQLLDNPKPVLVKIKANTPQQTFVRGYQYKFKIRLPKELMKIGYEGGFGEKGSLGFGMTEQIKS